MLNHMTDCVAVSAMWSEESRFLQTGAIRAERKGDATENGLYKVVINLKWQGMDRN